jgi:predicted Zn-dependent peptidase
VAEQKAENADGLTLHSRSISKDQAITGQKFSKLTIADKSPSEALHELLGLGCDEDVKFPQKIRDVTKAQIVEVAQKYLIEPVIVILTPDAK